MKTKIHVKGMSCGSCAQRVMKGMEKIDGVREVQVKLKDGLVSVSHSENVSKEMLKKAIEKLSFSVEEVISNG